MAWSWAVPLLAGVVAGVFAAKVWGQWSVRRRPHQLAWATGLTLYAVATLVDAYVATEGWSVGAYRLFFAVAASNVGFLGLGTILLARSGLWGRGFALVVVALALVAALGQFSVPLDARQPVTIDGETRAFAEWGSDLGAKPIEFPHPARIAFLVLNVVGGLALIGGALLSWWQTRRAGVLLIAAGALLPFLGGSLSTLFAVDLRVLMQLLGISVMFVGYMRGREALPAGGVSAWR